MAKLDDVISSALSGEAYNSYNSFSDGQTAEPCIRTDIKQTWNVTYDTTNFKWVVKSELYVKGTVLQTATSGGTLYHRNLGVSIGGYRSVIGQDVFVNINGMANTIYPDGDGIYVGSTKISSTPTVYAKVFEYSVDISCTSGGRAGIRICVNYLRDGTYYYPTNYTNIYLTLPAFSGMEYKTNGKYKFVMPWVKVNGTWKRAIQYIKIDGEWKEHKDTWTYQPS